MHSDPIADLLTRIRNGANVGHQSIEAPFSKLKLEVVRILQAEGFVKGYEIATESTFPNIRVHLKYNAKRKPIFQHLQRVSKPGLRIYSSSGKLKPIRSGLGTKIISTSQGVMTDREARKRHIGGEVLCVIW